jgi:hypothetical protein
MVGLRKGAAEMSRLALVTLVGHNLGECALGILRSIHPDVLDDAEASSIEIGTHTIRFGTDPAQGTNLLTRLHAELIENQVA